MNLSYSKDAVLYCVTYLFCLPTAYEVAKMVKWNVDEVCKLLIRLIPQQPIDNYVPLIYCFTFIFAKQIRNRAHLILFLLSLLGKE